MGTGAARSLRAGRQAFQIDDTAAAFVPPGRQPRRKGHDTGSRSGLPPQPAEARSRRQPSPQDEPPAGMPH